MRRGRWIAVAGVVSIGSAAYLARATQDAPPAPPPADLAAARQSATANAKDPLALAGQEMATAATNFLATLSPEQQKKATYEFKNDERYNWHFVPRERKGLPLKEMAGDQRALAHALLASGLSQRGFIAAVSIISLEQILKEIEQGRGPSRDPEMYFFTVFGKPGPKETWGWRVEGHHLSLNFTIVDGRAVAGAPSFLGSNPGVVREGPRKGLRVLGAEEDLGRQLAQSLDDEQKKAAILPGAVPRDIITGNQRKAQLDKPGGLAVSKLNEGQRQIFLSLLDLYARRLRPEMADHDLRRIMEKGLDNVYFAWAGSTEPGQPHYYRLYGPTFLAEYDNTQNNANHVHAVWRDLENDFGDDALRRHYEQDHRSDGK